VPIGRGPLGQAEHQSIRAENDGDGNAIYVGWAQPGSAEDQPVWLIAFFEYTAGAFVIKRYANGVLDYNQVWDDRAALTYI